MKFAPVIWIAVAFALKAAAMFDDQAGSYDWYKQHIGIVSDAVFHPTKPRVCVSTAQTVVGCLNLRDGSVAWRKLLDGDGKDYSTAFGLSQSQLLVTATKSYLRAFDLEGNQKWQRNLEDTAESRLVQLISLEPGKQEGSVVVLQGHAFEVLDSSDGTVVAKQRELTAVAGKANKAVVVKGGDIYVVAYDVGSSQATAVLAHAPEVYRAGSVQVLEFPSPLSAAHASMGGTFAALTSDSSAVCVVTLGDAAALGVQCQLLSELVPGIAASTSLRLLRTAAGYALLSTDAGSPGAALLALEAGGALRLVKHFQTVTAVTPEAVEEGSAIGLLEVTSNGGLKLLVVSPSSGEVLQEESYPPVAVVEHIVGTAPPLAITGAVLGSFRKKDKSTGYRALVSFSNGVTAMVQQGTVVWYRDESLASIRETLFAELPASSANRTALESQGSSRVDLQTRLRYQILGAKVQLKLSTPAEAAELHQLRNLLSDKNTPVRDVNGFRKLLLALTGTGKLVALHNGDGRVLWSRSFAPDALPTRLLQWRTYHDIQHSPEVLLLREAEPGPYAAVLSAHTGEELWRQPLAKGVGRVIPLHPPMHEGPAVQSLYLLLDEAMAPADAAPAARLLPDTPASRGHVAASQKALFVVNRGVEEGVLYGYRLKQVVSGANAGGLSTGFEAVKAWQLALPDSVLATGSRDPTEPIQSSVKVLSDRTIKYKYLNPNLLFVATGLPNGAPADADALSAELTVHLVDTVTGRVLHRQSHAGARGPVTSVLADNTVVYFFRDIDSGRYVACSMELYDATAGREFNVLDYLFNPNSTKPISSFQGTPLDVFSQAYFTRIVPTAATVTRTEQGITAKQLLLILNTDQVYALDRRWVDPRRPKKQKLSQDEMEEGLIPYQDTLPLSPLSFATLDKQVLGIRGVIVEATRLESSCLVFVHGVDLFFTRLAPAKGFDSLQDDFNYALLLAALVGLAGGAVFLQYMAKQTSLNQKWK